MSNEQQLLHVVFFQLTDNAPDKQQALINGCEKYLKPQPGVVFFSCGSRDVELIRDVNDKEFDVSLVVLFDNRESQDRYQNDEQHHQFIEEFKGNWKSVRVFDSRIG